MKFSIVIPTYKRESDLNRCLKSILTQGKLPSEIIIIDDDNLTDSFISRWKITFLKKGVDLVYYKKNHKKERRGSSESRNKALGLVDNEVFFILDDDVVLEKGFCKNIISIWEKNKDSNLIGVGGLIKNRRKRYKLEKVFNIIFGLNSKYKWDVNKVCFQVWDEDVIDLTKGYYAHGGVCSYDLSKVKELRFSTFTGGRTALEDVDFCLRAKNKGYHFLIQPKSELYHYPSKVSREKMTIMGQKESYNRRLMFKNQPKKPSLYIKVWFLWANIGWVLRQVLIGNFKKGRGMTRGLLSSVK